MTTVPTASGDAMTFADMLEQFNEAYAEFQEDFWDTYGRIVDMLNGALRSAADFVQDLLPFGIGGDTIDQAVDKWNNELSPALVQGMEEIQEQLSQAVNDLAGNPGNLQIWAENFVTARESIFRQRNYACSTTTSSCSATPCSRGRS